jgi:hypothetical protein
MPKVTIMLDDDILERLVEKQQEQINLLRKSVSFSHIVNGVLHEYFKK